MPRKMNQSPPEQQDHDREPGRSPHDELGIFVSASGERARNHNRAAEDDEVTDDPGINTHGSER